MKIGLGGIAKGYAIRRGIEVLKSHGIKSAIVEEGGDLQQEAIFWLGNSRGELGLIELRRLLEELPRSTARREINFALSENGTDEALETLINKVITESGAEGMQDMGKVMGAVKSAAQGLADMGRASALVKSKLA